MMSENFEKLMNKRKSYFQEGPIHASQIADSISKHQTKTQIGAHEIFLGQVRADTVDGKLVAAIDYTAYHEMANHVIGLIRETTLQKFDITCLHVHHSLGKVMAGEICLFVFVSSKHREMAREATAYIVEEIKSKVPIYGQEIFEDHSKQWKVNKYG